MLVKILGRIRRSKIFLTLFLLLCVHFWVVGFPEGSSGAISNVASTSKSKHTSENAKSKEVSDNDAVFKESDVPTLVNFDLHDILVYLKSLFVDYESLTKNKLRDYMEKWKTSKHVKEKVTLNKDQDIEIDVFDPLDYEVKVPDFYYRKLVSGESLPLTNTFDLRFTMATYLHYIRKLIEQKRDKEEIQFEVPFHWYDWVDLSSLNDYIEYHNDDSVDQADKDRYNCDYVSTNLVKEFDRMGDGPEDFSDTMKNHEVKYDPRTFCKNGNQLNKLVRDYAQNNGSSINFNVYKWTRKSSIRAKILQSRSYLYSSANTPVSMIFLVDKNFDKPQESSKDTLNLNSVTAWEFPIKDGNTVGKAKKLLESFDEVVKPVLEDIGNSGTLNLIEEYKLLKNLDLTAKLVKDPEENEDAIHVEMTTLEVKLPTTAFDYDYKSAIEEYEERLAQVTKQLSPFQMMKLKKEMNYLNSLKLSRDTTASTTKKYFHEVPIVAVEDNEQVTKKIGSHYDWRFFNGIIKSEEDTRRTLHHMMRTFLKFSYAKNIRTWVAHGSLLSWYWNGINFPWDTDTDVQMPIRDLQKFCKLYNNTIVVENLNDGLGRYFIDCGTYLTHRMKEFGQNNIDARFINIDNGIYIDITGLALSEEQLPKKYVNMKKRDLVERGLIKPKMIRPARVLKTYDDGLTPAQRYAKNARLQVYNCKNKHFVFYADISPLKMSVIEGTKGFVPNNYAKILKDEYHSSSMSAQFFQKHFFVKRLRLWVPSWKFKNFFKKMITDNNNKRYRKSLSKSLASIDNDAADLLRFLEYDETVLRQYYLNQRITKHHETELASYETNGEAVSVLHRNIEFPPVLKDSFLYQKCDVEHGPEGHIYDSVKSIINMGEMTGEEDDK